jgi:DNA (cytosine-5)-methyltransferase 1
MIARPVTFDERNIQFFSNENYKTFPTLTATDNKGAKAICYENHPSDSRVKPMGDVCQTVTSSWGTGGGNIPFVQSVAFGWQNSASQGMSVDTISPTLDKSKTPAVAYSQQPIPEYYAHQYCQDRVYSTEGITPALNCSQAHKFRFDMAVRRLTPVECERLQGFPDNYTNIKENCPDGGRYKALGNSMAVPVMRWIGERINKYEQRGVEKHL